MSAPRQDQVRNRLLSRLKPEDFARLAPDLELLHLGKGALIVQLDAPIEHAFFPDGGVGSIVAISPEGQEVEAGLFGRDGMPSRPC